MTRISLPKGARNGASKFFQCTVAFSLLLSFQSFGQVEIPVDMYTGRPSITVPIWTISSMDISEGIALSYDANSPTQESLYGAGWSLQAGGSISREVRTFPDDIGYLTTTKGWLYNNGAGVNIALDINNFNPTPDTVGSTYDAGEGTDYTKINGFGYVVDTEPDIFNYSFGGMSGSFVIDNGLVIRTMPYDDIKIVMNQLNATDKRILGFTITTNTGYVYTFDYKVSVTKSTTTESTYANRAFYVPTEYELYNPSVTYTREWKLTRIDSPDGAYMTFGYAIVNPPTSIPAPVDIGLYKYPDPLYADPEDIVIRTVYNVWEVAEKAKLTSIIASAGPKADFIYNGPLQSVKISDERRGTTAGEKYIKNFDMTYQSVSQSSLASWGSYEPVANLQFLKTITEFSSCERMPPYKFDYRGIRNMPNVRGAGTVDYVVTAGTGVDLWGYPNGMTYNKNLFPKLYIYPSEPEAERYRIDPIPGHLGQEIILEGANRHSGAVGMLPGTLQNITNPAGGVTSFTFEANQYLDTRTNLNNAAGGLRIKMISYFDGFNSTPVEKYFDYLNPSTGLSSGRLIRRPVLAMPAYKWKSSSGSTYDTTYTNAGSTEKQWKYLTIRTTADLTPSETTHGNTVGYSVVTVRRPGSGSARFEYLMPAIHGQISTGQWRATTNGFARYASTAMGIVAKGGSWMFPYTSNPDYDYQRGLVWKKSEYNEADVLVKKTETTYQNIYKTGASLPTKVYGLKYDRYAGCDNTNKIFFYGKYFLLTEAQRVPWKETVTSYDITDVSGATYTTESTQYFYWSANHKLITQIRNTGSDGNIRTTRIKYPLDYTYTATGANDAVMIGNLKTANRHGIPIEQIQTLKKGTDSTRVIGGSVIKLDPMGLSRPLVRSTWKLKTNPTIRIDSFKNSIIENTGGYKFKIDPRYEQIDSVLLCTTYGSANSNRNAMSRQFSAIGYGYGSTLPVVQLVNAARDQASFSDFETMTRMNFSFSGTTYYGSGRTGKNALHPSAMLRDTLTKAVVDNYILSFWIKSNASVPFTLNLKNQAGSSTYYTTSFSIPSTGGTDFVYVQKIIPMSAVSSPFRFELQATGLTTPPPGNAPYIDDVFFYPENAEMTSTTYALPFGASSVTNGNGNTVYNEFDFLGRPRIVYDKNRNIVKRNVYTFGTESPLVADFSWTPHPATPASATTMTAATNSCVTDATYKWDIGDGNGFVSGSVARVYTFPDIGTFPVQLKVTSATYGTKTVLKNVTVVSTPYPIDICAKGVVAFVGGVPDVTASCASITGTVPSTGVAFKVFPTAGGTISYQWKRRDVGSGWVNVGGNSSELWIVKNTSSVTYEVMCVVTSTMYGAGNSPPMEVTYE